MIDVITDKHYSLISELFNDSKCSIKIISPFLSKRMADILCDASKRGVKCSFISRFYLQDFLDGSNSLEGLQEMLNAGIELFALVGLHTKLYLFDTDDAIVGSANFTEGGLVKNIELSLHMKEEEAIDRLHEYFDKIVDKVKKEKDGIITQDMLDDYKISYEKHKRTKTELEGGNSIIGTIRGAVLDRNARNIIEDTNGIYNEIQNNIGERLKDCVYLAMGGKNEKVSHKRLKNIILKFSASSKDREDDNKPMPMYPFKDDGKLVYVSNFSSVKSAEKIEDDDEVFFVRIHIIKMANLVLL